MSLVSNHWLGKWTQQFRKKSFSVFVVELPRLFDYLIVRVSAMEMPETLRCTSHMPRSYCGWHIPQTGTLIIGVAIISSVVWLDTLKVKLSSTISHPVLTYRLVMRLCASMDTPSPPVSTRRSSVSSRPRRLSHSKSGVRQAQTHFPATAAWLMCIKLNIVDHYFNLFFLPFCADVGMIPVKR